MAPSALADATTALQVDGQERTYLVHLPPHLSGSTPLILAFHGAGGNASGFTNGTNFNELADERHFIAVYPQGINKRWNAALAVGQPRDIDFILAIIQKIKEQFKVSVVYATGFSNGAMFANALACSGKLRLAAIAVVAGLIPQEVESLCAGSKPVSVLEVAASRDPVMPFGGGQVPVLGPKGNLVLSFERTLLVWAKADGCKDLMQKLETRNEVKFIVAGSCQKGFAVEGVAVDSGLHSWSGGGGNQYPIQTSRLVVNFLLDH